MVKVVVSLSPPKRRRSLKRFYGLHGTTPTLSGSVHRLIFFASIVIPARFVVTTLNTSTMTGLLHIDTVNLVDLLLLTCYNVYIDTQRVLPSGGGSSLNCAIQSETT